MIDDGVESNYLVTYFYSLAAGLSTVLGPLVYLAASPLLGTLGVMLVFAALYVVSALMTYRVRDAADPGENLPARGAAATAG